jgi:hypothetical protein
MSRRPLNVIAAILATTALVAVPFAEAQAGSSSGGFHGNSGSKPGCGGGGVTVNKPVSVYKPTVVNNSVNIYKPVTINKDVNVYKPTTIEKNITVNKPVTIDKSITVTKNIDNSKTIDASKNITINKNIDASKNITINKNVSINKSIVINKGGEGGSEASAFAQAFAQASANASASANVVVYGGNSYENTTVINRGGGGDISAIQTTQQCRVQEASVVKAIHAVCVSPDGREFPASHMMGDTWIDTSRESEVLRCIPGAHLRVTIGDVLQSDQGMAGTYAGGQAVECGDNEALRHYKDGMLKCAVKQPVPDCTERLNLRKYGTGDLFFSYRATVCAAQQTASQPNRELELTGMSLSGGVGDGGL